MDNVRTDFDAAFNKSAQAIEAIAILGLTLLIAAAHATGRGLEKARIGLINSTTWTVPGNLER